MESMYLRARGRRSKIRARGKVQNSEHISTHLNSTQLQQPLLNHPLSSSPFTTIPQIRILPDIIALQETKVFLDCKSRAGIRDATAVKDTKLYDADTVNFQSAELHKNVLFVIEALVQQVTGDARTIGRACWDR